MIFIVPRKEIFVFWNIIRIGLVVHPDSSTAWHDIVGTIQTHWNILNVLLLFLLAPCRVYKQSLMFGIQSGNCSFDTTKP